MSQYSVYMQRVDKEEGPVKNLEVDFPGLVYYSCEGLSAKGEPKNIYTESYADSDGSRVWIPKNVCRESTDITLSLLFKGDNRRDVFDEFYSYVKNGIFYYWDTVRKRRAKMFLSGEVETPDDIVKGGGQYLLAEFPFTNVLGETEKVTEE